MNMKSVLFFIAFAAGVLPAVSADVAFLENAREIAAKSVGNSCRDGRYRLGGLREGTMHKHQHYMGMSFDADLYTNRWIGVSFKARGTGKFEIGAERSRAEKVFSTPSMFHPGLDMPFCYVFGPVKPGDEKELKINIITEGCAELRDLRFHVFDSAPRFAPTYPTEDGAPLPEGYVSARELPLPEGEADLAERAQAYTFGSFPSRLGHATDGARGTYVRDGLVLKFPEAVTVTGFRWMMPQRFMEVYADMTGDGMHETLLFRESDGPAFSTWKDLREYVWRTVRFAERKHVYSLFVRGDRIYEFEVTGPERDYDRLPARYRPKPCGRAVSVGEKLEKQDYVPSADERLWFGFCLEPWMFGVQDKMIAFHRKGEVPPPVGEWSGWRKLADDFHSLYANFILLFPPNTFAMPDGVKPRPGSSYPYPLMWPSDVWYVSQTNDLLRSFNEACRRDGFLDFVIPRAWDFREGESAEPKQVALAREIAERGSDGVPVCYDEQYFYMPLDFRNDRALREEFYAWSGQTNRLPEGAFYSDDKITRLGYLFSAHRKARWMAAIKDAQMQANPDAVTFGGFAGCDHYQARNQVVSGCDFWGWEGRCDVIGGDGTYFGVGTSDGGCNLGTLVPAVQTAVQLSCTPRRKSMATVNFNWGTRWNKEENRLMNPLVYDDYPDMAYKAAAMASYFAKGEYLNFWRYNFMDMKGPSTRKAVGEAGRMTRVLAAWGARNAEIPKDVLVLRSRTSEDWWGFRYRYRRDSEFHLPRDRYLSWGFHLFFWTSARLAEKGIPFEVYQMQRVEAWREAAKKYRVIVLPFAYSVSDEELAALKEASDAGVKILVVGGPEAGTVDGLGERRETNAFEGLPVFRYAVDSPMVPSTRRLADGFTELVVSLLGKPSLSLDVPEGYDVQAYMLSVGAREKLFTVANWSERDTSVNLSLALPKGRYRLEVCSGGDVCKGLVDGREVFTGPEASSLRFDLKKEDVLLFRVRPSGWF